MSNARIGEVGWIDLTVGDAAEVHRFYQSVVGWKTQAVSMGDYDDWCMVPPASDHPVAGICHARGTNADLPPVWLIYFYVDDLVRSMAAVEAGGGEVLRQPRPAGGGSFCVIRDPAGAICGLYQSQP